MQLIMVSIVDIVSWRNLLLFLTIILFGFYKWMSSAYNFFKRRDVVHIKPIPFFGSVKAMILGQESLFDTVKNGYLAFKEHPFFGVYEMFNPIYFIRDLELIKKVTIKDFDHFANHRLYFNPKVDKLFSNSLFSLQDEKWRDMRATLSPAFTSSKMRQMLQYVDECCRIATGHLKSQLEVTKDLEVNIKDLFTRFTADAIAICTFGIQINSQLDKSNEFYRMTLKGTHFTDWEYIKIFLFSNFYKTMTFLNVNVFDLKFSKYFYNLVWSTMEKRIKEGIIRPDMIHLLLELRNRGEECGTNLKGDPAVPWTDDELVAQCFIFFVAGFETTSVTMGFIAHELMENPSIQTKLIEEIDQIRTELAGKPLTYDTLKKMKYMDMVVSETLRKWPPLVGIDRVCCKPYNLTNDNGKHVKLDVGDLIIIPVAGIHRDPDYYPDPGRFDPERFNDENVKNIVPFSYIPFGTGPRHCIGSRFALMKIKAIIFHLLSEFTLEPSPKSRIPISLTKLNFQLEPEGGMWMYFRPRR